MSDCLGSHSEKGPFIYNNGIEANCFVADRPKNVEKGGW